MVEEIAEEFWREYLQAHPVSATLLGYREHDDRMPDVTPEGRRGHRARLAGLAERLRTARRAGTGGDGRVTGLALEAEIDTQASLLDAEVDSWTVDPLGGPQVSLLQLAVLQTVETPAQGAALVARYRAMGPYLDATTANLHSSLAADRVAPACAAERVARQIDALLASPVDEWKLLEPARAAPEGWKPAERERFRSDLEHAVRVVVRPAFERLHDELAREILPRARPQERAGLCHVPGGDAAYGRLIRVHTGFDLDPEEVHSLGLQEVDRIRAEMRSLGERALGSSDLPEILHRLREDRDLHFRDRDEIEATAVEALARARAALPDLIGRPPRTDCVVRRLEPFEEEDSTVAYYRPPAVDGSRPGHYCVNTFAPSTRPRYEAEALAFHESIPGHHVQIALAQERTGLPEFRRHLGSTAYVEGWGLYAERLADECGLYSGDLERIGMLSFDAWRAGRLVVDTGLHALGWSRARAVEFLMENSALAENNVVNEVDRYIVWPGQALAYKIGQREILALRAQAQERLGGSFDRKRFHDRVLENGALPLPLLRRLMGEWLDVAGR